MSNYLLPAQFIPVTRAFITVWVAIRGLFWERWMGILTHIHTLTHTSGYFSVADQRTGTFLRGERKPAWTSTEIHRQTVTLISQCLQELKKKIRDNKQRQ